MTLEESESHRKTSSSDVTLAPFCTWSTIVDASQGGGANWPAHVPRWPAMREIGEVEIFAQ